MTRSAMHTATCTYSGHYLEVADKVTTIGESSLCMRNSVSEYKYYAYKQYMQYVASTGHCDSLLTGGRCSGVSRRQWSRRSRCSQLINDALNDSGVDSGILRLLSSLVAAYCI